MAPQNICNLLDTLPKPPWTMPLNWDLLLSSNWEERISFHLYVHPDAFKTPCPYQNFSFPQFDKLPSELQLRVLNFCSASALFQLMRVSSALRVEAARLFWANPNSYYVVECRWLLKGGFPGNTCYDLSFLTHVQNIEVEFKHGSDDGLYPARDDTMLVQHGAAGTFWKALKKRFPNVRRVIINQIWQEWAFWEDLGFDSCGPQILVESCPPEIDVSAFVVEKKGSPIFNGTVYVSRNRWKRSLCQLTENGEWKNSGSRFGRSKILLPMKRFCGPVGEFKALEYIRKRMCLAEIALGALLIEALDRYHFDEGKSEPFLCPIADCDAFFEMAGEWSVHAAEVHSNDIFSWLQFDILPTKLRGVFKGHYNGLEKASRNVERELFRISDEWRHGGPEKRRAIENVWIDQLENDEAWDTGEEARESNLWKKFTDPTYYGW
ncbi:MAG: hypothetical protein M1820_007505 [Bogoriella megaspora]|nr:MAG: hypothetical protein M1820_007505 [Bogoriella megaspora]